MTVSRTSSIDTLIEAFQSHLQARCGLCVTTQAQYLRHAKGFLEAVYKDGCVDLGALSAPVLIKFVTQWARGRQPSSVHCAVTALRSFLRFLQLHGLCDPQLVNAVPTPAYRQATSPPTSLDAEELDAFLVSFDRSTPTGQRGYAIALCMVMLGLRAKEVAGLTLDDVDWRTGTVRVGCTKTHRLNRLPLPKAVGEAIVEYLREGRLLTGSRHIFVRHAKPRGEPLSSESVRAIIRRAFNRSGIETPSVGTHILRRTAATRMVQHGATLKEAADVLGHRSLDIAKLYAKVNLTALAEVALPWPGAAP
jgi:integrase/recombinase XerD